MQFKYIDFSLLNKVDRFFIIYYNTVINIFNKLRAN